MAWRFDLRNAFDADNSVLCLTHIVMVESLSKIGSQSFKHVSRSSSSIFQESCLAGLAEGRRNAISSGKRIRPLDLAKDTPKMSGSRVAVHCRSSL
eukprot:TRINITY_DN11022_c0_g1_i2.p1 TRINITY_DN11022_c0_g1~~TRINITY_DN11022_c0_g1_i2.p1  ORF type:complete len:110 (-),score=9.06 TRINITY_DN11022_c0_g1_i2:128-415(-)